MKQFLNLQTALAAAVLALAIGLGSGQTASAGGSCHTCKYVKVVTYKSEVKPYVKWVKVVDDYGCVHKVKKICYRTVKVPVVKWVKVCY